MDGWRDGQEGRQPGGQVGRQAGGQVGRQAGRQAGRYMPSTDPSNQDMGQVRIQYNTFRKLLEVNALAEYCENKIHYNRPNHIHNYTINNSLAIIRYI
jgi:hypothetical protein